MILFFLFVNFIIGFTFFFNLWGILRGLSLISGLILDSWSLGRFTDFSGVLLILEGALFFTEELEPVYFGGTALIGVYIFFIDNFFLLALWFFWTGLLICFLFALTLFFLIGLLRGLLPFIFFFIDYSFIFVCWFNYSLFVLDCISFLCARTTLLSVVFPFIIIHCCLSPPPTSDCYLCTTFFFFFFLDYYI